jgi:putative ABC transport system substrate-binding protein
MLDLRRRQFLALLGGAAAWPLAAGARPPDPVRRIGILMLVGEADPQARAELAAFTTELQRLGWVEAQNVRIHYRWADGDVTRLQALATQLVALRPDLVLAQGSAALAALRQATRTLPIVFADVTDPVGQGFVESVARPGGNVTGFAMFEFSMGGKWLDLLKKLAPSTKRVAVLFNPPTPAAPFGKLYFQSIAAADPRFGIEPFSMEIDDEADVERGLSDLAREPNSGLIVLLDAFTYVHRDFIIAQAGRYGIPAVYTVPFFVRGGGLASYGVDLTDQFRQAATYVDRIFKGVKPAELPVMQPTTFKLVINVNTARSLGVSISDDLLSLADEVIE